MMKTRFMVLVALLAVMAGCLSFQRQSGEALANFKRAPSHDRSDLAEPAIAELRSRIGMSMATLIELIGDTDIKLVDRHGNGVLKYTVYHRNNNWHNFGVTIRDWKVTEIGNVESVIQM